MVLAMVFAAVAALKLFGVSGLPIKGSMMDLAAVAFVCAWVGK